MLPTHPRKMIGAAIFIEISEQINRTRGDGRPDMSAICATVFCVNICENNFTKICKQNTKRDSKFEISVQKLQAPVCHMLLFIFMILSQQKLTHFARWRVFCIFLKEIKRKRKQTNKRQTDLTQLPASRESTLHFPLCAVNCCVKDFPFCSVDC